MLSFSCDNTFLSFQRAAFFAEKKLGVIFGEIVRSPSSDDKGRRQFEQFMRGVRCVVSYDSSCTFFFKSLTCDSLDHPRHNVKGMSIVEYMESKGITIERPSDPGCHLDQPNGETIIFPLGE